MRVHREMWDPYMANPGPRLHSDFTSFCRDLVQSGRNAMNAGGKNTKVRTGEGCGYWAGLVYAHARVLLCPSQRRTRTQTTEMDPCCCAVAGELQA